MHRTGLLAGIFWLPAVFAARHIDVSVCNLGALGQPIVERGKAKAQAIFDSSGIIIEWLECGEVAGPASFTIRLREANSERYAANAFGYAFLANDGDAYLADVYIRAIADFSELHDMDSAVLLGAMITHEIGHLLLGRGHTVDGIMRSTWSVQQITALQHGRLAFNPEQRARMERTLAIRTAPVEVPSRNLK